MVKRYDHTCIGVDGYGYVGYSVMVESTDGEYVTLADHNAVVAEKDKAYHELTEQAVRFAEDASKVMVRRHKENQYYILKDIQAQAEAFLARPDVVAWRKQQEGTHGQAE